MGASRMGRINGIWLSYRWGVEFSDVCGVGYGGL